MHNPKVSFRENIKAEVLKSFENVEIMVKNIVLLGSGAADDSGHKNNLVVIHKDLAQSAGKKSSYKKQYLQKGK